MTDRPIIFSAPMVRALLDGRKTQTRRLATSPLRRCEAGDRLYVRESGNWQTMTEVAPEQGRQRGAVWYAATGEPSGLSFFGGKQRPSIHMPRWASRLTLVVTCVLVEPLQSISPSDCVAEGHPRADYDLPEEAHLDAARDWYMDLWDSLHKADGQRWRDNPQVVALEFEVSRGNIDRLAA